MPTHNLLCSASKFPLISGEVSRQVLDAIKNNNYDSNKFIAYGIEITEIEQLTKAYKRKLGQFPYEEGQPRYLHFYLILKDKFPQINWNISDYKNGKPIVNFKLPLLNNLQPSLISILLDRVSIIDNTLLNNKYKSINVLDSNSIKAIEKFMQDAQAIYPDEIYMCKIVEWVRKAISDHSTTIFIHTCPDYEAEPINNLKQMYRHTFNSLGSGIGQIAKRALNLLPNLKLLLKELNINPKVIVSIADYEAFSEQTLARMNLTKNEFLARVRASISLFGNLANDILPVETYMFMDICGGQEEWVKKTSEIKNCFANGNFGLCNINNKIFKDIATSRKALYKNWFNDNASLEQYIDIAMSQAAEYAAIGFYIHKQFQNCLVIGTDSVHFAEFYNFYSMIPTLYFKRFYC